MSNLFIKTILLSSILLSYTFALAAPLKQQAPFSSALSVNSATVNPQTILVESNTLTLEEQLAQIDPIFKQRWYKFDIIIFLTPKNQTLENELWPTQKNLEIISSRANGLKPLPSNTANPPKLSKTTKLFDAFQPLDIQDAILSTELKELKRSKNYEVVFHRSWFQPVFDKEQPTPIIIQGGKKFGEHNQLEGSINMSINRFLHANIHLSLTEYEKRLVTQGPNLLTAQSTLNSAQALNNLPWSEDHEMVNLIGEQLVPSQIVILEESRRMRSNELHYIDHPLMGILIKAMPYEHPQQLHEKNLLKAIEERDNPEVNEAVEAADR